MSKGKHLIIKFVDDSLESDAISHSPRGTHLQVDHAKMSRLDRCKLYLAYCKPIRALGEFGFDSLGRWRKPLNLTVALLQLVCFIFAIVCTVGMSSRSQDVKNAPWATYKYTNMSIGVSYDGTYQVYLNLEAVVVSTKILDHSHVKDAVSLETSMTLSELHTMSENARTYGMDPWTFDVLREVSSCGDASHASQVSILISCILQPLCIFSAILRAYQDHGCHKLDSLIGCILNPALSVVSILTFYNKCYDNIEGYNEPQLGVGFILNVIYFVLQLLIFPAILLCPCPELPDALNDLDHADSIDSIDHLTAFRLPKAADASKADDHLNPFAQQPAGSTYDSVATSEEDTDNGEHNPFAKGLEGKASKSPTNRATAAHAPL